MSVQGDYNSILRCTFLLYQPLEATIKEKQPNLCSSFITSSIFISQLGALNHKYPELSVARLTLDLPSVPHALRELPADPNINGHISLS